MSESQSVSDFLDYRDAALQLKKACITGKGEFVYKNYEKRK